LAIASAFDEFETDIPENKIVPHSSRERPGDVKKQQGALEHRIRRSAAVFSHRRR
jgi:hypothetical protein